jgi:serine/threonine-protein kinase
VVGTARYAAPEQVRGEKLDSRADVYSLALLLVEATTGIVPFAADTTLATLMARVERPLTVSDQAGPLKPVLEAAGAIDPAARLDAAAFALALERAGDRLPPPAPLPLAPRTDGAAFERDEVSPTELPGRPQLFDGAESEPALEAAPSPPSRRPGSEPEAATSRQLYVADDVVVGTPIPRRRRRWVRRMAWAAAIVILAGAAAVGAAFATGRFTPLHPVPALLGDTRTAAQAALTPLHLHLAVSGSKYQAGTQAGTVLSQDPSRGKLREGRTVQVVLSLGPQPVRVPTLQNLSLAAAEQVLTTLGLKWSVGSAHSLTVGAGNVISSSPDQGTLLPGQAVAITVSTGKPTVAVPVVASQSYASEQDALSAVGLGATETQSFSDIVPKGQVIGTSPAPGSTVTVGTVVSVQVSKGPDLVAIPSVSGDSVGYATQVLANRGFSVTGVAGNPISTVTGTSPAAGTLLHRGAGVQIVTG